MAKNSIQGGETDELAAGRCAYQLLSRLWLCELDDTTLQMIASSPLSEWFTLGGDPSCDESALIDLLARDYCQLFVGPSGHLPPFQSVWQTGQFQSHLTVSMSQFIDVTRYESPSHAKGAMVDHLGVQLDVLAHLYQQCLDRSTSPAELGQLLELRRCFVDRHLCWPEGLLKAAMQQADCEFYQSLVRTTRWVLQTEYESCSIGEASGGCGF